MSGAGYWSVAVCLDVSGAGPWSVFICEQCWSLERVYM